LGSEVVAASDTPPPVIAGRQAHRFNRFIYGALYCLVTTTPAESIGCTANCTEKRERAGFVARKNAIGGPWKIPGARLISGEPIQRRFRCVHPKLPFWLLLSLLYRHCRPLLNRRPAHRALHLPRLLPLPPHRRSAAQLHSRALGIFPAPLQVWTKSQMMEFRQKP
jgi:hypothetical protein